MSLSVITGRGERLCSEEFDNELLEFGKHIEKRSLMFCLCKNELGSLVGYLGAMKNKVVPVMLDAAKDSALMKHLLDIYRPNYIWAPRDSIVVYGQPCYTAYEYALYKYDDRPAKLNDDLALLLTTSGSTGSPKLVRLSYENILSNAESIAEYLHIDENERPVSSLPMHYSFGLSVINSHYVKGATLLLTNQPVIQKKFWEFIQEEKATSMAGVPFTYEMLRRLKIFQMNLPYMKTMIQAGGKLEVQLVQEYVDHCLQCGKEFIVMYGQTEASPRMSYLPWKYAKAKPASIGIAIPNGKFSLIDAHDKEITKPDIDGELIYEGPNVCLGYAECREDLQKGDENQGILHTGDVARRDADGFYYITGRMKRFVKLFGNRVNLDATEQLLKSVTLDVACVGVDDKLTTFITDTSKLKSVKKTLVQKTGLNLSAFDVRVIDTIPKKSSGKLDYTMLKEML